MLPTSLGDITNYTHVFRKSADANKGTPSFTSRPSVLFFIDGVPSSNGRISPFVRVSFGQLIALQPSIALW